MHVEAINLVSGHVLLNGSDAQITNWFDCRGEEIPDSSGAISAVARVTDSCWLTIDLRCFERPVLQ